MIAAQQIEDIPGMMEWVYQNIIHWYNVYNGGHHIKLEMKWIKMLSFEDKQNRLKLIVKLNQTVVIVD